MRYWIAAVLIVTACSKKDSENAGDEPTAADKSSQVSEPIASDKPSPEPITSINQFFAAGNPTFVLGTAGDELADRRIAIQVGLIRSLAFPDAQVVTDSSVTSDWPANPVLYGNADTNSLIASLADDLPFKATDESIEIGGLHFEGMGFRIAALVPVSDKHPQLVLYAGTGKAGIAEINANLDLSQAIVIADSHGTLVQGQWQGAGKRVTAKLGPPRRRIEYRSIKRPGAVFHFPAMVPESPLDAPQMESSLRAIQTAASKLQISAPAPLGVYLYPDRRSKEQLTGNGGHGHAVPSSRSLHMLAMQPDSLEALMAHESTHVLAYFHWGPAGTPLLGEGLAVWVSGQYGGKPLSHWTSTLKPVAIADLLGQKWRTIPEQTKYPLAAAVFETIVAEVGLNKAREFLYSATADRWSDACASAGTTMAALDKALAERLTQ